MPAKVSIRETEGDDVFLINTLGPPPLIGPNIIYLLEDTHISTSRAVIVEIIILRFYHLFQLIGDDSNRCICL